MTQPKLMPQTATHHDGLALLHPCVNTGVVVSGKLHRYEFAEDAGLTAESDRVVVHRILDHDIPENSKYAFGGLQNRISGVTAPA
jgi:hypothetical protein